MAQCLGQTASGDCPRARCRRALRRFFSHGSPALTHALLFCPCSDPTCAERRRQTFVPACAFSGPGPVQPSCLVPLDACEQSRVCRWGSGRDEEGRGWPGGAGPPIANRFTATPRRPRLLAFQASCAPVPGVPDGCPLDQASRCLRAYAGLVGTQRGSPRAGATLPGFLPLGGPTTRSPGPRRHCSHPQLRGQRERARGALVQLWSQRKPAGGVRGFPAALYQEPLLG